MSTRVLLATLSIPITPERTDIARLLDMDGIIVEKHRRLATLLALQSPPTRQSLINDMVHYVHNKEALFSVSGFNQCPQNILRLLLSLKLLIVCFCEDLCPFKQVLLELWPFSWIFETVLNNKYLLNDVFTYAYFHVCIPGEI